MNTYCRMLLLGMKLDKRTKFDCDFSSNPLSRKECGKKKTLAVPFSLREMELAYKESGNVLPSSYTRLNNTGKRYFMCDQMEKSKKFCNVLKKNVRSSSLEVTFRSLASPRVSNKLSLPLKSLTSSQSPKILQSPKFTSSKTPKNETFEQFRRRINRDFRRFKYDKITIKNMCNLPQSSSRIVEFTPSQNFISHYFVPKNDIKGLLVWHSVGTGKTCTAVATKSRTWEQQGYTIVWVTRTTLRADIWKNMFDKVCDIMIREKLEMGIPIPEGNAGRKYIAKNFLNPVSFSQFSNVKKCYIWRKKRHIKRFFV